MINIIIIIVIDYFIDNYQTKALTRALYAFCVYDLYVHMFCFLFFCFFPTIKSDLSSFHPLYLFSSFLSYSLVHLPYPIRSSLDKAAANKLVHSISRLDYRDSLYLNAPGYNLKILQRIINHACRFISHSLLFRHTSDLFQFSWLPIVPHIHF